MREKGILKSPKTAGKSVDSGEPECTECVEPEKGTQKDNGREEWSEDHFSKGQPSK